VVSAKRHAVGRPLQPQRILFVGNSLTGAGRTREPMDLDAQGLLLLISAANETAAGVAPRDALGRSPAQARGFGRGIDAAVPAPPTRG